MAVTKPMACALTRFTAAWLACIGNIKWLVIDDMIVMIVSNNDTRRPQPRAGGAHQRRQYKQQVWTNSRLLASWVRNTRRKQQKVSGKRQKLEQESRKAIGTTRSFSCMAFRCGARPRFWRLEGCNLELVPRRFRKKAQHPWGRRQGGQPFYEPLTPLTGYERIWNHLITALSNHIILSI